MKLRLLNKQKKKAKSIGIYFDGCKDGTDCNCCGDRWHDLSYEKGSSVPEIYGKTPLNEKWEMAVYPWNKCYIYYLDGTKEMALKPSFD